MVVAPVAAVVVPICPAWCGAVLLWRVLALAVVLLCGLSAGAGGSVLCGFALCAGGAGGLCWLVLAVCLLCWWCWLWILQGWRAALAWGLGGTIGGS